MAKVRARSGGRSRPPLSQRNAKLEQWKTRVELSRLERNEMVPLWVAILNYLRSNPPTNWPSGSLKLQVNYVFAWFESVWPRLTFNNPQFTCTPKSAQAESSAPTVEAAINNELTSIGWGRQLKRMTFDFLIAGIGILQVGYYGQGLAPKAGVVDETPLSNVAEAAASDLKGLKSSPKGAGPTNSDLPYGFFPGRVYVRSHLPENFLVDPMATCLDDALWCGIEYVRPIASVKKDPQYKNTDRLASDEYELPSGLSRQNFRSKFNRDPSMNFVRMIQIWDIVEGEVVTFNMNHGSFLGEEDWNLPTTRFPFVACHATEDNYTFWNQAPTIPWISLVEEFNHTISNRLDHLSRNKPKVAFNADAIAEAEVENFLRAINLSMIKIEGLGPEGDVRSAISPIQMANMPADHWGHVQEIRQRMTEISGQSEFDLGGTRPGERPATEVSRIGAAGDIRVFGLASRITEPLRFLAEDVRAIMEKYYSKERAAQIVGDEGNLEWVQYTGSGLKGEFQYTCDIEDLAPVSRQEKQQRAGIALQMLTPYSQVGSPIPRLDIDPLLRYFARDLKLTPYMRFFPSAGPPMSPDHEFFLMLQKGMTIEPNPTDDDDWHSLTHQIQEKELADNAGDPRVLARLRNHIEAHEAQKLSKQAALEGQQQQQQQSGGNGTGPPGPTPGGGSNNPTGGAGIFSGSASQVGAGGPDVGNLASLLRGQQ